MRKGYHHYGEQQSYLAQWMHAWLYAVIQYYGMLQICPKILQAEKNWAACILCCVRIALHAAIDHDATSRESERSEAIIQTRNLSPKLKGRACMYQAPPPVHIKLYQSTVSSF
jgi:hypothetical protein